MHAWLGVARPLYLPRDGSANALSGCDVMGCTYIESHPRIEIQRMATVTFHALYASATQNRSQTVECGSVRQHGLLPTHKAGAGPERQTNLQDQYFDVLELPAGFDAKGWTHIEHDGIEWNVVPEGTLRIGPRDIRFTVKR